MLSEIENKQVRQDYQRFKQGIGHHLDALQYYIDCFTLDGEEMALAPDLRGKLRLIILDEVIGKNAEEIKDKNPFIISSIKRLWRKINKS